VQQRQAPVEDGPVGRGVEQSAAPRYHVRASPVHSLGHLGTFFVCTKHFLKKK
jgi:hypothetical protein